jgi:GMP synthase-like glutamine amidotransferase
MAKNDKEKAETQWQKSSEEMEKLEEEPILIQSEELSEEEELIEEPAESQLVELSEGKEELIEEPVEAQPENRLLILDNYPIGFPTDRITRLEKILQNIIAPIKTKTLHFTELDNESIANSIGIILSGSSYNVSEFYYNENIKKKFEKELQIIRNADRIPILGICFGHQIIGYAYNAQICRMRIHGLGEGIVFIKLKEKDTIITKENIPVNGNHRDFISINDINILNNFKILSVSKIKGYRIIQYMKHQENPIFSVQFHPETHHSYYFHPSLFDENIVIRMRTIGEEIIENFVWRCIHEKNQIDQRRD